VDDYKRDRPLVGCGSSVFAALSHRHRLNVLQISIYALFIFIYFYIMIQPSFFTVAIQSQCLVQWEIY
jgi:hypothetical protein